MVCPRYRRERESPSHSLGDKVKKLPVFIGGGVGAFIGSSVGIAAMGTAFSGTLPLALLGAGAGWLWSRHKEQQDLSTTKDNASHHLSSSPAKSGNGERIKKVCMTDRTWIADREQDCKHNAYECSMQIRVQLVQARVSASKILNSNDMWAQGYVFGFAAGWMQQIRISNADQEGMFFLICHYRGLQNSDYNVDPGIALSSALNNQNDPVFMQGMLAGGEDAISFKQHDIKATALTKRLSTSIIACKKCGQKLRVPKDKVIDVICPSCKTKARIAT